MPVQCRSLPADTTDRRMNLQSLHENADQENGARIKMRAQNRTKLMAAIVLLVIAGFLLLRMYRQQKSAPTAVAEQPPEVPTGAALRGIGELTISTEAPANRLVPYSCQTFCRVCRPHLRDCLPHS
jgi:hypothetical protein